MIHISLFSGIGGFDLAADWMGWKNYVSCEINPFANKILQYYWPKAYHHEDITTLTYDTINTELTRRFGNQWRNDEIILTGGFPCQPFSMAGKRKGTDDERYLWGEMLRTIQEVKPEYVIAENVLGIVNIDGGLVFEQVCLDLEAAGYEVQPFILPACAKNAPHRRDRVWFIAQNTLHSGCVHGRNEQKGTEVWQQRNTCTRGSDGFHLSEGVITNTDLSGNTTQRSGINADGQTEISQRQQPFNEFSRPRNKENATDTRLQRQEKCKEQTTGFEQCGEKGDAADTDTSRCKNRNEQHRGQPTSCREGEYCACGCCAGFDRNASDTRKPPTDYWRNFPTQSPICSRNDEFSARLDGITFSKWRNESIKGYGNAIVPVVAYELFLKIEQLQQTLNNTTNGKSND